MKREKPDDPKRLLALAADGLAVIHRALVALGQQKAILFADVWRVASKVEALAQMIGTDLRGRR